MVRLNIHTKAGRRYQVEVAPALAIIRAQEIIEQGCNLTNLPKPVYIQARQISRVDIEEVP